MAKTSLKQIAYQSIKDRILNCEYAPNSFLNEDMLCEAFGVSRTPIRDALGRLEQENLITILPKKGFLVAPLTANEINMVFEGRSLMEPYIIEHYSQNLSDGLLKELQSIIPRMEESILARSHDIHVLDDRFHQILLSQCPNRYLLQAYQSIHDQNARLRIISGRDNDPRLRSTMDEHQAILDGLLNHKPEEAAEAMREHLNRSRLSAFESFLNNNGSF